MIYLCIAYFFSISVISYRIEKSYIAPAFLYNLMMLVCSIIVALNYKKWGNNAPIYPLFVIIIVLASFTFSIGCLVVKMFTNNERMEYKTEPSDKITYKVLTTYPVFFLNVVAFLLLIIYLIITIKSAGGFQGEIVSLLRNIYTFNVEEDTSNFVQHQIQISLMGLAYISWFEWLSKRYITKERTSFSILFPVIFHLIATLFSTDRNILIRFVIYCLILWVMFFRNREEGSNSFLNKKILKRGIAFVFIVAVVFYFFGKAKDYKSNFFTSMSVYGGSGLFDLNYYINRYFGKVPLEHGSNTFGKLLDTLSFIIGENNGNGVLKTDDFIYILMNNGFYYSSNIYTGLFPILKDFGIIGVAITLFCLGIYYSVLYLLTKKYSFGYTWIFYSSMIYPVIYMPILDQFFSRLHLGIIYEIFWVLFWYIVAFHISSSKRFVLNISKVRFVFRRH